MTILSKYNHISKSIFVFGTLFSSLLLHNPVEASPPSDTPVLIADVSPVNPLHPDINVDPVPAPPDYKNSSTEDIHPSDKPELKKEEPKAAPTEKKKKEKRKDRKKHVSKLISIKKLNSYSFDSPTIALLTDTDGAGSGKSNTNYTTTGEMMSKLSGLLVYGIKK